MALRLVCEREAEVEAFLQQEYWSVACLLEALPRQSFEAQLVQVHQHIMLCLPWAMEGTVMHPNMDQ